MRLGIAFKECQNRAKSSQTCLVPSGNTYFDYRNPFGPAASFIFALIVLWRGVGLFKKVYGQAWTSCMVGVGHVVAFSFGAVFLGWLFLLRVCTTKSLLDLFKYLTTFLRRLDLRLQMARVVRKDTLGHGGHFFAHFKVSEPSFWGFCLWCTTHAPEKAHRFLGNSIGVSGLQNWRFPFNWSGM